MSNEGLRNHLSAELSGVQALIVLLTQEQDALIKRQFDAVQKIIEDKNRALQALELASKARAQYCSQAQLQTIDQIEVALGEQIQVWQDLRQSAKLAEMMNRTNGQLIETHEEANRFIMSNLAAQRNPDVGYSADGRLSQLSAISRPFDRA
ncbi:flagellar protein FlgN [Chitinibacter bivalviorum]|uniref:Flagellar protein FlgN n=1 Tax=Chitinibacter bivalviorum TaxID=2739434 RepID=A0A7H9BF08_9NEIS|nr:flagellar protein FlgN [Chitinibacter bivalviorum]QLG87145.1 flagellar protein FlgN [Chitinibacter bivalviorum]